MGWWWTLWQLKSGNPSERRRAVEGLGASGQIRAIKLLIGALGDKDQCVRQAAAQALGKIGSTEAIKPLAAALRDKDRYVREAAAQALRQINNPQAAEVLEAAFQDEDDVRLAVIGALREGEDPWMVEARLAALQDKNVIVRQRAVSALGERKDTRTVEALIAALQDEDKGVRGAALQALAKMKTPGLIEPLTVTLRDEDKWVREMAVKALAVIKDTRVVEPLLTTLQDEDNEVRAAVVNALRRVGDAQVVEPLLAMAHEARPEVRQAALEVLGGIGARLEEVAFKWGVDPQVVRLYHKDRQTREVAAQALGQSGDAHAVEPLLLAFAKGYIIEAAVRALGQIGARLEDAALRTRLVESLLDTLGAYQVEGYDDASGHSVYRAVVGAVGQIGDLRAVTLLAEACLANRYEGATAAEALARMGGPAREQLLALLKDGTPYEQHCAKAALDRIGSV